jgi:uncharacterized protein YcbX
MRKIVALRRYPLKSALGESLEAAELEPNGLAGDRMWACVDDEDGSIGSAKHPRRWGKLLEIGTALQDDELTVRVDGTALRAGSDAADAALTRHLGRPVRLTRTAPPEARLHRLLPDDAGMVPECGGSPARRRDRQHGRRRGPARPVRRLRRGARGDHG